MPSFDLFTHFQADLTLQKSWWVNGRHYGQTCEDWLIKQDSNTKTWIGSGREKELVSRKNTPEKELMNEGRRTFYRLVVSRHRFVRDN